MCRRHSWTEWANERANRRNRNRNRNDSAEPEQSRHTKGEAFPGYSVLEEIGQWASVGWTCRSAWIPYTVKIYRGILANRGSEGAWRNALLDVCSICCCEMSCVGLPTIQTNYKFWNDELSAAEGSGSTVRRHPKTKKKKKGRVWFVGWFDSMLAQGSRSVGTVLYCSNVATAAAANVPNDRDWCSTYAVQSFGRSVGRLVGWLVGTIVPP